MSYIDTKYLGQCETCRHHRSGKCDTWCENGECYRPLMSKIPTADVVEVKHGSWDASGRYKFATGRIAIRCSECECSLHLEEYEKYHWNYCPNCGAKMDGGRYDLS